ncbi:hypothetical protein D3C71_1576440 [compost metagenome]
MVFSLGAPGGARVVDEDVDGAKTLQHLVDQAGDFSGLLQVVHHRQHLVAQTFQVFLGFGQFVGLARRDGELGAHFAQGLGHLQAQPARSAGDQSHLAGEIEELFDAHGVLSPG